MAKKDIRQSVRITGYDNMKKAWQWRYNEKYRPSVFAENAIGMCLTKEELIELSDLLGIAIA